METVGEQDVADALRPTLNWKATGREQIPDFGLNFLKPSGYFTYHKV